MTWRRALVVSSHDCRNTYRWSVDTIRAPSSFGFYRYSTQHRSTWTLLTIQLQQSLDAVINHFSPQSTAAGTTVTVHDDDVVVAVAGSWLIDTCSMNTKSVSVQNASDKKLNPYQMSITYELLKAIQIKRTSVYSGRHVHHMHIHWGILHSELTADRSIDNGSCGVWQTKREIKTLWNGLVVCDNNN